MTGEPRVKRKGRGGSRVPPPPSNQCQLPRSNNIYGTLDEDGDKEMNPHLAERFHGSSLVQDSDSYPRSEYTPVSSASHQKPGIQKYFEDSKIPVAGGSWLSKSEIPTPTEILPCYQQDGSLKPIIDLTEKLQPNKIEGPYDSIEQYLGTQYNLLREDAIRPLREAVENVSSAPFLDEAEYSGKGIGLYEPVYIKSYIFSGRGLATRVEFSLSRVKKHVRWSQSKRLINGTLVALSPADDYFQTKCVLAVVGARPLSALDQNPPEIDLFFARAEDMEVDPMRKWVMVESRSSFFEASRHTLLALQHMIREPFPLSKHLVLAHKEVEASEFVLANPYTDLSSIVTMEESVKFENINILKDWPAGKSHGLDNSQSRALNRILTKSFAIVQGPPGTGKTYVSTAALKVQLANMRRDDPPIIVTCQTNHALDQMLRHVAEFEPSFIRLGGRCKDKDKVKKRTLYEVRSSVVLPVSHGSLKNQAMKKLRKLTEEMQMLLAPLEANKPPLDQKLLVQLGLITAEQALSLEVEAKFAMGISPDTPGIQMELWLGKCLAPSERPIQPDDFGETFEEEDFDIEQLQELEAEAVAEDDDFETLRGPSTILRDNWTCKGGTLKTDDEIREILRKTKDLSTIPLSNRGTIYNYLQRQVKRLVVVAFRNKAKIYQHLVLQRRIGQWEHDFKILRDQRLVGMTTTGLSKYRGLVASLKPKIVLVEEAAETLEAPVTVACLPSVEQLILVGDHQQLRPHCQVHELEDEPYHFNLSLFERMVLNDVEVDCLTRQRRMIPEIRRVLVPIYGDTLKDHISVVDIDNRPPVQGMGGTNSFFFTHEWLESKDANMSSMNENEAAMIVGFFDYLVLNGVDPEKITVLTFYNGQRKLLIKMLRQHPNLRTIQSLNVVTVDSYQGEENDIILLSLVRSNKNRKIGFLNVNNRVCVALSRARRGFYVFGNAEMLAIESDTWAEVVDIMYDKKKVLGRPTTGQKRRVGYHLPLKCTRHGRKVWIADPTDWGRINGGCDQDCRCILPCGHTCMLRCHPFDNGNIQCTQKCTRKVDTCNHPCSELCCDSCRCHRCDRRDNGTRSMLRPGARAAMQSHPIQSLGITYKSAAPELISGCPGSSVENWHEYGSIGAQKDDADVCRKANEEEAKVHAMRLVKVVQEENTDSRSANTGLLVDVETSPQARQRRCEETHIYTRVPAEPETGLLQLNLLD